MPQYPGNFPGDPGSRPPLPPPLAPPVQPFPHHKGRVKVWALKKVKIKTTWMPQDKGQFKITLTL